MAEPYVYQEYPKMLYHKSKPALIVNSEEEEGAAKDYSSKPFPLEPESFEKAVTSPKKGKGAATPAPAAPVVDGQ